MRFPDRYQNPEDRGAWSETETDAVDFHGSLQIPRLSSPASIQITGQTRFQTEGFQTNVVADVNGQGSIN